jgi:hypothetical protein
MSTPRILLLLLQQQLMLLMDLHLPKGLPLTQFGGGRRTNPEQTANGRAFRYVGNDGTAVGSDQVGSGQLPLPIE